ncbi:glycosyltransferase [Paenibacillus arenosi]|uniref:Glycosyltransferase family 1 protein n=1 Tax=Paenibacillus arenosi TaxID=2774142 RepID=A0ABR9AXC7_9BACL|nr:glycosyltransferase [Paenibacillus arenosi]MBD8498304.1 glycosyltransferase family 1 protein [Paenibacillus arenosi]
MRIIMLTIGTRGDVQPFVALGVGLQKRGYEVVIATSSHFESFVLKQGIGFSPIRADYMKLTESEEGKRMLGNNPLEILKQMKKLIYPMITQMLEDIWAASQHADVLIYHPKVIGGYDIAQKRGIPAFIAHPTPIIAPTGDFTNPILPISISNRWLNEKSYVLNRLFLLSFMGIMNKWRRETLNLPARSIFTNDLSIEGRAVPILYGCSPATVPYNPKWGEQVCMEGYWLLQGEDDWKPSRALVSFLENGSAPIVISFSSMPLKQPDNVLSMLKQALKQTGQRAIILTGSSGMQNHANDMDENILYVQEAPHSWLFPLSAGVIHHGGAGTTAAAVKAGKPMTICPFSGDQPFWARRMHELGVSTPTLLEKQMTAERFAEAIYSLVNSLELNNKAASLSEKVNQERGVERTIDFVDRHLKKSK